MPEHYRISLTHRASDDLVNICAYIAQDSPTNAALVAQEIVNAFDSLELLPRRYRIHERRSDPAKTVHAMPVPPFIVYYRVVERRKVVEVAAVRHGHQRQPRQVR